MTKTRSLSKAWWVSLTLILLVVAVAASLGARSDTVDTGQMPVTFIAFGDAGDGSAEQATLANLMAARAPSYSFAVLTGDGAYPSGSVADYQAKFFPVYNGLL